MERDDLRSERRSSSTACALAFPDAGQLNALETHQSARRALGDLQGQVRSAPSAGPLPKDAPAVCEKFRQQPDALEAAAALDKQYGTQAGSGEAADVLRRDSLEELVRREGHALDRRQRREFRDGCSATRTHPMSQTCASKGADHLRDFHGLRHRPVFEPRPGEGEDLHADRQFSGRRLGRAGVQSLRHLARTARHEQRLGRLRVSESRDLRHLRADLGVLQRPGLPQRRGQPPCDQGRDDGRWSGLLGFRRSRGRALPYRDGCREGARCGEGLQHG